MAQTVVKQLIEPALDSIFLADSYGYRPGKSALDAVGVTRDRCWKYNWVLEFDIRGLFDNIDHELLLRAVRKHVTCAWALLYIERWLTAPMQQEDGTIVERSRGTPQGGVVSPILANHFMHYAFDTWMTRRTPDLPWCRYADDGLVHCRSEKEAQSICEALAARLAECGLELHPTKTKIVYCKDHRRKSKHETVSFDFLGYCFRPRSVKGPSQKISSICRLPLPRRCSAVTFRGRVRLMIACTTSICSSIPNSSFDLGRSSALLVRRCAKSVFACSDRSRSRSTSTSAPRRPRRFSIGG